jgi:two-component system chemotaxis response regulator CheB
VAPAFGPRAVGVLLSGCSTTECSAWPRSARGGTAIGQTPEDELFPAMPTNARAAGVPDRQAAASDIGAVLKELSNHEIEDPARSPTRRWPRWTSRVR